MRALLIGLSGCAYPAFVADGPPVPTQGMDEDGDGFETPADCDDANPAVHPGQPETCDDAVDDNCDGLLNCIGETDTSVGDAYSWDHPVITQHAGRVFTHRFESDGVSALFIQEYTAEGEEQDDWSIPDVDFLSVGASATHAVVAVSFAGGPSRFHTLEPSGGLSPATEFPPGFFGSTTLPIQIGGATHYLVGDPLPPGGEAGKLYHLDADGTEIGSFLFPDTGATFMGTTLGLADVDGDGDLEVLVGTAGDAADPAAIWAMEIPTDGDEDATITRNNPGVHWVLETDSFGVDAGIGIAFDVGDVDGDGCEDLVVGTTFASEGAGAAYVVRCLQSIGDDFSVDPFKVLQGANPSHGLGISVAILDDFFGPGGAGVAVGTPGAQQGLLRVFRARDLSPGDPFTPTANGDWLSIVPFGTRSRFSGIITPLGDIDADGREDFAASSANFAWRFPSTDLASLIPSG